MKTIRAIGLVFVGATFGANTSSPPESGACWSEGMCLQGRSGDDYLLCASQYWQTVPSNGYSCVSGTLTIVGTQTETCSHSQSTVVPSGNSWTSPSSVDPSSPTVTSFFSAQTSRSAASSMLSAKGTTVATRSATTTYLERPVETRTTPLQSIQNTTYTTPGVDQYGVKSYVKNGKMGSVYDASSSSTFRCQDVSYPLDELYVAFWTQYEQSLADNDDSQPAPLDCGDHIEFANPLTGKSATALVLDRCASCVGVGNTLNDPTVSDSFVNGATVDFSRALWDTIFEGAPDNFYDVLYYGRPLQGMRTNATE